MPAVFVTGTGTDVGKTYVASGLIRFFRQHGRAVSALKPIVSGYDPDAPAGSDPAVLLGALGEPITPEDLARISPWRFRAPLSPDMAARAEKRVIDFERLVEHCRDAIPTGDDLMLIEGIGGVMVPLDQRHTVLDLMERLAVPLVLVGGTYLGALSHVLCAQEVLRGRGLDLAALVISESPGSAVRLDQMLITLERFAAAPILALPRSRGRREDTFAPLAALIASHLAERTA